MPPKMSPVGFIPRKWPGCTMPGGMPTRGIVHNGSGATALPADYRISVTTLISAQNLISHKVTVEKRGETPYGTRSYLPGGAVSENRGGEEAGCPPVFLVRKAARKTLLL